MKNKFFELLLVLAGGCFAAGGTEAKFPTLQVGGEVYSNVTVTTVTATDIYFTHAKGMGNARLRNLSPELQKQFKFDPVKGEAVERGQAEATASYLRQAATNRPARPKSVDGREELDAPTEDAEGELVAAKLYAASFRGQRSPQIIVAEWLTPAPEVENKFVLVEFWATWAEPARETIPHLNELQARFKDRLVIIGLSNEPAEEMKKMTAPKVHYRIGTDPEGRTLSALQVRAIPHALLIDPNGIVRYEGHSKHLDAAHLEKLIAKYGQ
jgi:cytochrome c biogenesis protein CcmG/thiol:disulfide interchange protein DsbE